MSAANVEHVLKTNFDNYEKGERFRLVFEDLLGEGQYAPFSLMHAARKVGASLSSLLVSWAGIFNVDGEAWRTKRKVASHMFAQRVRALQLDEG